MYKLPFIFFVLIFTFGCKNTATIVSTMPSGVTPASQFIGTYYGDVRELSSIGTQNSEPVLRRYGVTLNIEQGGSPEQLDLTLKLCNYYNEGTITLDLTAMIEVTSDGTRANEFEVFSKRFPTQIFSDRSLVVNGGMGEIDLQSTNILMNLSITTESRDVPENEVHNVWSMITIDTNAEGAGDPEC
jgi:hypothetical protein